MNKEQREAALEKIKTDKSIKCILISFKAGSTGNLFKICGKVSTNDGDTRLELDRVQQRHPS